MFKLELGKFCYKFKNNSLPNSFNQIFTNTTTIHNYNTRNATNNFFRPHQINRSGYKTLQNLGSKLWNEIPIAIKNSTSIYTFAKRYKKYILQNYSKVG